MREVIASTQLFKIVATLVAVLISTRMGGAFGFPPTGISPYWPANAIFFASLLLLDRNGRMVCLALAYPTYLLAELWIGFELSMALVFSLANCLEVGLALALALRFVSQPYDLGHERQLLAFLAVFFVITPVGGLIGAAGIASQGGPFATTFSRWVLADFVGFLVFVPLVLTLPAWRDWALTASVREKTEAVLLTSILLAFSFLVYGPQNVAEGALHGAQFLPIPLMLWIALRFGPKGASVAALVVSASAIWLAVQGPGPFSALTPETSVLSLQVFITSLVLAVISTAVLVQERNVALRALQQSGDQLQSRADQSAARLVETQDKYRLLVEAAPICIHEINLEGRLTSMNAAGLEMMGAATEDEIKGLVYGSIPDLQDQEHVAGLFADALKGESSVFEFTSTTTAGRKRFQSCFVPIKDLESNIVKVMGVTEDTTQRTDAENKLRRSQRLEAVGQLTGGVAHDFNNLLAVIMGNTELLADAVPEQKALVAPILSATRKGADLTQRLLAFARRQTLRPEPTDLVAHLRSMEPLLTRSLGETIQIEIVAEQEPLISMVDNSQFENAILNLSINARDAMPEGGRLRFVCRLDHDRGPSSPGGQSSEDHSQIIVSVVDEGTGMTADVQEQAFEPFFTTKDVGKGSGLGLAMAFGFAKQSGGDIALYSSPGEGTTISMYLPVARATLESVKASDETTFPIGNGQRIVLIEDEDDVRSLSERMLKSLGYDVITASDAAEARVHLKKHEDFDLVLSDVVLPGGTSGPEFVKEIRNHYPDVPIMYMSGYPTEDLRSKGLLATDDVILDKPFRKSQLARAISDLLAER